MKKTILGGLLFLLSASPTDAQQLTDVHYDVVFNAQTALRREIHVEMSFDVAGAAPVSLSLPAWTPGSYELDDFAKNVEGLWAREDGVEIRWDKADCDTWRVYPTGAGQVTVGFDYRADEPDPGAAWTKADFAFFNGTNLFFFPEGQDLAFESVVTFDTEPDWNIVTGLDALSTREYTAESYDELVDNPAFVGRFDLDSLMIDDHWYRLATYPQGTMAGPPRGTLWSQIQRMMPPLVAVTGDTPFERYTVLQVFDPNFGGGSALEHSRSHLGIYHPTFLSTPVLAMITAHEIFHAWNVKRLRPADLWPYDYGRAMPTELLWISEGITDYYADLSLVRGGIVMPAYFYQVTQGKIDEVRAAPPVALEDASLSTWIGPRDGTSDIYYPKGSLAGLMLDILIRDASDNRSSLDDVFASLYRSAYLQGRGFTADEWWSAVSAAAGGRSFQDFHDAYVDGRDPYPWGDVLPLAGLRLQTDVERVPRMGVMTSEDSLGVVVVDLDPGGQAAAAGVEVGDHLVSVGDITVEDGGFGADFREAYANAAAGTLYDVVVARGERRLTLPTQLQFAENTTSRLVQDDAAPEKAQRIRRGILTGSVDR